MICQTVYASKNYFLLTDVLFKGTIMKLLLEVMMVGTCVVILILLVVLIMKINRNERNNTPQ